MSTTLFPKQLDCIIPAAGLSTRMGCWKLMLPYKNRTIIDISIENALSFCSRVILVVGYRGDEIFEKYKNEPRVKVVFNTYYEQGMFSSIQHGVKHVNSEYFFISHGDMPCVPTKVFKDIWIERNDGSVFPGTQAHPGHPVLIHRNVKSTIVKNNIKSSMRSILSQFTMKYLGINYKGIYFDVDTPEDYDKLFL